MFDRMGQHFSLLVCVLQTTAPAVGTMAPGRGRTLEGEVLSPHHIQIAYYDANVVLGGLMGGGTLIDMG